ncbi:MAG: DUF177 domain-containing protein [Proteobacteria bacterium]|nr:DUF177 domain-containing protein [Pseudomonadota bacterium]
MNVLASRISGSVPFVVRDEVSPERVDAFFEMNDEGCRAISPLRYEARLIGTKRGIRLEASINAELERLCSRCGKADTLAMTWQVVLMLVDEAQAPKRDEVVLETDDLDVIFYKDVIDLEHIVLETVYVELDSHYLCDDSCHGVCLKCGANLNETACRCHPV